VTLTVPGSAAATRTPIVCCFWFAKGSDLRVRTKDDLQRVQDLLNKRPRPTLDLGTLGDRLSALFAEGA